MNAFMNSLEKMGSNFLVAAMVPSLAFVIAVIFMLDPLFHFAPAFGDPNGIFRLVGFSLLLFIFTVIIGFTLTALNTYILKIFEGYVKPLPIRAMYTRSWRSHRRNAHRLRLHRDRLKNHIRECQDIKNEKEHAADPSDLETSEQDDPELADLMDQYYQIVSDYQLSYPENPDDVLPTRFGNTLKAAENYSGERYGFDGIHFWPRLVDVISPEYKLSIDNVRNELSFLVNMSTLSFLFSSLSVVAIFIALTSLDVKAGGPTEFVRSFIPTLKYFAAFGLGIVSCVLFYKASILSVGSFGLMIRSAFDLFRFDLLKRFGIKRPSDSDKEFYIWQELNELIVLGQDSLTFTKIDYSEDNK